MVSIKGIYIITILNPKRIQEFYRKGAFLSCVKTQDKMNMAETTPHQPLSLSLSLRLITKEQQQFIKNKNKKRQQQQHISKITIKSYTNSSFCTNLHVER